MKVILDPRIWINKLLYTIPAYKKHIYNKEKAKFDARTKTLQDDIVNAVMLLKRIDAQMKAASWSRSRRKQFWYDFHKHDQFREDIFEQLLKGVGGGRSATEPVTKGEGKDGDAQGARKV